jgi:hypothetical protein
MKSILLSLVFLLQFLDIRAEDPKPNPDSIFSTSVDQAIESYLTARESSFRNPKTVTLFLIAPVPYTDAELEKARKEEKDNDPIVIGDALHKVFEIRELSATDAKKFGGILYDDLVYPRTHGTFRLVSFCMFSPMHAFKIVFQDGAEFEGAICTHCGDLMFQLPGKPRWEEYRGLQTTELPALLKALVPVPRDLEAKFFPRG